LGENLELTCSQPEVQKELFGDVIGLLQSPAKNVVSALQSGQNIIAGLVKTLSEKE
jgi:large subunit ribosomal protein L10